MHIVIQADMISNISLVITAGAFLMCFGVGLVLGYHWKRFALSPLATTGTLGLYGAGCLVLLTLLFTTAPLLML